MENFEKKDERPNIQGLLVGLEGYNSYFNWGAVVSRNISDTIRHEDGGDSASSENLDETGQQARKFEELKNKFQQTLDDTGIFLEPVKSLFVIFGSTVSDQEIGRRVKQFSEETGITAEDLNDPDSYETKRVQGFMDELQAEANESIKLTEMRLNVSNAEKFVSYLDSFQGAEVSHDEKESLVKIAEILEKQFVGQYDVSNPDDDRFLVLIGSLEKIITKYEDIGLGDSVQKLKKLLEITRKKYVKEYLMVERKGYLVPHEKGFGPAKWYRDMSPENYESHWKQAMDTYEQVASNPNAKELADELHNHLLEAIEISKRGIESTPRVSSYQINNYPEFLKTLEKVHTRLFKI